MAAQTAAERAAELAADREAHIREIVAASPPFTEEQKKHLRHLLLSSAQRSVLSKSA